MKIHKVVIVAGCIAVGAASLAACGSGSTTSAPTTTTVLTNLAAQQVYVPASHAFGRALAAYRADAMTWPASETGPEAEVSAQPAIAALNQFVTTMTTTSWPTSDIADAQRLASAASVFEADLQALGTLTGSGVGAWVAQFEHDGAMLTVALGFMQHDLGLS